MIRLRTLGKIELSDSEDAHDFGAVLAQPMRTGVLAYLVAATPRGLHTRDRLMGLFWPESTQARARHALNQTLYALRRDLGRDAFVSRGNEVGIDPDVIGCDAAAFERLIDDGQLAESLELYAGDLLDGFFLPDRVEFDQWLEGERRRLRVRATDAARRLGEDERAAGNLTGAASWMRRAARIAPFDEAILRELVEVLGEAGDRAGALREYDRFARRLESELEVAPASETRALIERLRSDDTPARDEASSNDASSPRIIAVRSPNAGTPDPIEPSGPERARGRGRKRVAIAAGFLAAIALIAAAISRGTVSRDPPRPPRILVPAFRNETGDATLDGVGDIAADWIATALTSAGAIQVVPSLVALRAMPSGSAGRDEWAGRVAELANETEASLVVSGAYYRRGDSLLFAATLARPGSATTLGTVGPVASPVTDPIAGIDELGRRVTGSVAAFTDENLSGWVGSASRPPSIEAYQTFADGMTLLFRHGNPPREVVRQAAERFRAAAALDSTFDLALIWAVHAYTMDADYVSADSVLRAVEPRRDALAPWDRAMVDFFRATLDGDRLETYEAMQRVVRLAPSSEWRFRLGTAALNLRRPRAAVRELTAIDPDRGWVSNWRPYWSVLRTARHLSGDYKGELADVMRESARYPGMGALPRLRALVGLGRVREVIAEVDGILDDGDALGPAGNVAYQVALELHAHGHDEEYRALLEKVVAWFERSGDERGDGRMGRQPWAWALLLTRRYDSAERILLRALDDFPDDWTTLTGLAMIAAARGDSAEARRLEKAIEMVPDGFGESLFYQAAAAANLGETDRAISLLRESWAHGLGYTVDRHVRPFFEPLRGNPAFEQIFRPIG